MDFIIFLIIILVGFYFGRRAEKKHYASILQREEKYKYIPVISDTDAENVEWVQGEGILCTGGTVIALDAFKKLMAWFVSIFGWRMKAYESLVDRARREAILKVKQKAEEAGYNCIVNLRIETSSISKNAKKSVGSVEALAYATAIRVA